MLNGAHGKSCGMTLITKNGAEGEKAHDECGKGRKDPKNVPRSAKSNNVVDAQLWLRLYKTAALLYKDGRGEDGGKGGRWEGEGWEGCC